MISEESGNTSAVFTKSHMRDDLNGRYQKRDIYDNARQESEDLWEYSSYAGEGHSNARIKGTIAQLTSVPYQTVMQNLPNQTFRSGHIPHSYEGVTSFFESHEPDTQKMRPDISPLEFIGLVQPDGVMPNNARYPVESKDPHNIMVLRQKMKTSYALPPRPAVKYVDERTSRTFIDTLKNAPATASRNKGITLTATAEYKQTIKDAALPTRSQRVMAGVDVKSLVKKFSGVFNAKSFAEGMWNAGSLGLDTLNPDSDLATLVQNLQREGLTPTSMIEEAFRQLRGPLKTEQP